MAKKSKRKKPPKRQHRTVHTKSPDITPPPEGSVNPVLTRIVDLVNEGNSDRAQEICLEEITRQPASSPIHNILGVILLNRQDPAQALAYLERAVHLDPSVSEYAFNKALAEFALGYYVRCIDSANAAIAIDGDHKEAWNTLGQALSEIEEYEKARDAYEQAIRIDKHHGDAWINLSGVLQELDAGQTAVDAALKGTELRPDRHQSFYNLGRAYGSMERWEESIIAYEKCISISPDYYQAFVNVSRSLMQIGELVLAERLARKAMELAPEDPHTYVNTGFSIFSQARYTEALDMYRKALELDPEMIAAHNNIAHTALAIEDFSYGWEEYEWGFLTGHRGPLRPASSPIWDGESLAGKMVHVIGEQGIGEQLMFSTMLPDLSQDSAAVIFECEKRLVPLYARSCPELTVVPLAPLDEPAHCLFDSTIPDYRCAVGSLGRLYRTSADMFTPRPGFLRADAELEEQCSRRYRTEKKNLVVGISWKSNSIRHGNHKNAPLEKWGPILQQAGCTFVSLQYGDVDEDIRRANAELGVDILVDPDISPLESLDECAAQIAAVDLVISISNATVHMAGALGKETWLILSEVPCWHWFVTRDNSLWYESVSMHRRVYGESWDPVVQSVAERLAAKLSDRSTVISGGITV